MKLVPWLEFEVASLSGELSNPVFEVDALDELTEALYAGDAVPVLARFEGELQHHRKRTLKWTPSLGQPVDLLKR